jgi:hypothetical protein
MRNVSDKICGENEDTHFVIIFFLNRAVGEIITKNTAEPQR